MSDITSILSPGATHSNSLIRYVLRHETFHQSICNVPSSNFAFAFPFSLLGWRFIRSRKLSFWHFLGGFFHLVPGSLLEVPCLSIVDFFLSEFQPRNLLFRSDITDWLVSCISVALRKVNQRTVRRGCRSSFLIAGFCLRMRHRELSMDAFSGSWSHVAVEGCMVIYVPPINIRSVTAEHVDGYGFPQRAAAASRCGPYLLVSPPLVSTSLWLNPFFC
jgi:hypothetical protein